MRLIDLHEGKWFDDSGTLTLYHGTSSQFLDVIKRDGLKAPQDNLDAYAEEILSAYVPREQWTPEFLRDIHEKCLRIRYSVRGQDGRENLYLCSQPESPTGYAQSYAAHGGEIAYTIWQTACMFVLRDRLDDMTWKEFKNNPPLRPRFEGAKPVLLTVEVPREWARFHQDIAELKRRLTYQWEAGERYAKKFATFDDFADDVLDQAEVRIAHTIPWSMITDVKYL